MKCLSIDIVTAITTDKPHRGDLKSYYLEVTSKKMVGVEQATYPRLVVGFCTLGAAALRYPSWDPSQHTPRARSWAYRTDDGTFRGSTGEVEKHDELPCEPGDTFGCGVDVEANTMWVTKNGERIETDFYKNARGRLFRMVRIFDVAEVETNFRAHFKKKEDDSTKNVAVKEVDVVELDDHAVVGAQEVVGS